jgi:hydrogenase maturation protease
MRIVVGGVSQLYQGDLDLGRHVVESLRSLGWSPDVIVEDFHYGAVAVSQQLDDLEPDVLILVGAEERGRLPGTIKRTRVDRSVPDVAQARESVEAAVTGYVTIDLIIDVIKAFGSAPGRIVVYEVEPKITGPSSEMSEEAVEALRVVVGALRREVELTPLFVLCDDLRRTLSDHRLDESSSMRSLMDMVAQLEIVEESGAWGKVFSLRDRLRLEISRGETSENISHLDWSLWWSLIEELDRLQREEAVATSGA